MCTKNNHIRVPRLPCIFLLIFFTSISFLQAQVSNIEIKVKNKPKELFPGKHYTLVFEIKNTSKDSVKLDCNLNVPPEFKSILSRKKVLLKPNSKKNIMFTFGVSKYCSSGNFSTTLSVAKNKKNIFLEHFNFKVEKIYNIHVDVIKAPEYLRLEKDFYCEYLVSNYGNSAENIELVSKRAYKVTPSFVTLKPDSSIVVKVYQEVPETFYTKTTVLNNLKVKLISYDTIFSNRVPITVYPKSNKAPDLYKRFPISISTIFNSVKGLDTINAVKYKISGRGFIDKEDKHFLSFNYSGPNQNNIVRFGEYEKYSVFYKTPKLEASLGDVNFSLSDLTENSRYGLGGIFTYKFPKTTASLFYVKPRFTNQISDSYGGKLLYNLSSKTYLQFGVINRSLLEDNDEFKSQVYSLISSFTKENLKLKGEIAYETNYKSSGFAFSIESYFGYKKLFFGNSIHYSDKNYKGYLRNSKQLYSNFKYKFSKKFRITLGANYSSINPVKDTINYASSPILTKYLAYISYKINKQNKIKIGGYIRKKEDRFTPKKFNFGENLMSLSFQQKKTNKYNFNLYGKYGTSVNYLIENAPSRNVLFSSFQLSVNINKYFITGINSTYQQTNKLSDNNELIKYFYYGGFLQYNYRTHLSLNLFYKSDYDYDELSDAQSFLEARLNYNYKQRHLFSLSVSQSSLPISPLKKELYISANYSFVINVPLLKDKTVGAIKGTIVSEEKDNLEGVLVILDNKIAITDKNGNFSFYNLAPKSYSLAVKQSSLPKGKIILEDTPYLIDVTPNKDTFLTLHLGKTGGVIGQVKFKKTVKIQSEKFIKKLPRVIVKIQKGTTKFLTKIDEKGNFEFKELTPGTWTIELLVKNLIKDFKFDKVKTEVEISSNNNSIVTFNVSNKNRFIKKSKKKFKL